MTVLRKFIPVALLAVGLLGSAFAQNSTTLTIGVQAAGVLSVNSSALTLSQTSPSFTAPWTSPNELVSFSYRDSKTSGAVNITLSATTPTGAVDSNGAPPLANITAVPTAQTLAHSGGLATAGVALSTSASAPIFTDGPGTHEMNQSFNVMFSLAAGDYAVDTWTTTVTYTMSVT